LVLSHGLDSGILDPLNRGMLAVIQETEKQLGVDVRHENDYTEAEVANAANAAKLVLEMKANGDEDLEPEEEDRELTGVYYAAQALLGLDEDGYCMEYIDAYKDDLFGVPKK